MDASTAPLRVVCALWRRPDRPDHLAKKRYLPRQVGSLRSMLQRHHRGPVQLIGVTNVAEVAAEVDATVRIPDAVASLPSQYPKLWLQSRAFAEQVGPEPLLYTDLDVVVLGDWAGLLGGGTPTFRGNYSDLRAAPGARRSGFALLTGRARPDPERRSPPFSTSLASFRPGELAHVWDRFSLRRARSIRGWTGTDQKWMNWVLGRDVRVWPPGPRFGLIGELLESGAPPPPEMLLVTCTHRLVPWDPELRDRLPWLAEAYPLT